MVCKSVSFFYFYLYSVIVVPIAHLNPTPPTLTFNASPPALLSVPMSPLFMFLCLPLPLLSSIIPLPPSPLVTVSVFHVSMLLVLFCSLVCFVHSIPLICEIVWYLSFTAWLISLSIMLSSSTHAVTKGRSSFFLSFFLLSLVFHCVNVP